MNPFSFDDYREYLDQRISSEWGAISRLAKAARCHSSYLSRALRGDVLLTPDHLFHLCTHWQMPENETDYLLLLLEKARSSSKENRDRIETKLRRIRQEQENLQKRLETPTVSSLEQETLYYSAWYWIAIHLSTSIETTQTESAISQSLQLSSELVKIVLDQLEKWGYVRRLGARWKFSSGNLHLPRGAALIFQHHMQWRNRAVLDSMIPKSDGLHYSQVQVMDENSFRQIKELFLRAIDESLSIADPAKCEKLVAVNLDVFRV